MRNKYNSIEDKAGNTIAKVFSFFFYIYFVLSLVGFLFYFLKLFIVFRIIVVLLLLFYFLELLIGIERNFFGIPGIIICGIVGFILSRSLDGTFLGILVGIFIGNFILILIAKLLGFLIRKFNK